MSEGESSERSVLPLVVLLILLSSRAMSSTSSPLTPMRCLSRSRRLLSCFTYPLSTCCMTSCHLSISRGDSGSADWEAGSVDDWRGDEVLGLRGDRGGVMRLMRVWRIVSTVLCSNCHHGSLMTASTCSPAEAACSISERCSLEVEGMARSEREAEGTEAADRRAAELESAGCGEICGTD